MVSVSVITSTYNKAGLLRETVRSVLAQTAAPLEYLVADDGSTDDTGEMLRAFGSRVTHLRLPHRGQPAAPRNVALAQARGDWVALVDHDDLWHPEKLERQLALAQSSGADIVCCNAELIDGEGRPLGRNQHEAHPLAKEPDPLRALIGGNFVVCSSVLARAELLRAHGGFCEDPRLIGVDDYDLWLQCALHARIEYQHTVLVSYRWGHGNLSTRDPWQHVEALAAVRDRFITAAGPRATTDLAEPLRQNWRRLQHARYKVHAERGEWGKALGPWLSVQAAKLRGRR